MSAPGATGTPYPAAAARGTNRKRAPMTMSPTAMSAVRA